MRFAIFAILLGVASAFTAPSMTFAVSKKAVKAAAKKVKVAAKKAAVAAKKDARAAMLAAKKAKKAAAAPKPKKAKVAPPKKAKVAPAKKAKVAPAKKAKVAPAKKAKVAPAKKAKKAAPKKAPVTPIPVQKSSGGSGGVVASKAIPNEVAPDILDGSLVGDVGFDPCFLSTKADAQAAYFNGLFGGKTSLSGLDWYREAELMHGRISMVAVLGFIIPGFTTFAGNDWTGVDAYSYSNPLEALDKAPGAALFQIFSFMAILEFRRITFILKEGSSYVPGDAQKWGQGEGRWNPFGFKYTPAEYEEKQLQEIKHARLAMIGLLGLYFQANISGVSVVDQLSLAFTTPDYVAKAGYFLPEGI